MLQRGKKSKEKAPQ